MLAIGAPGGTSISFTGPRPAGRSQAGCDRTVSLLDRTVTCAMLRLRRGPSAEGDQQMGAHRTRWHAGLVVAVVAATGLVSAAMVTGASTAAAARCAPALRSVSVSPSSVPGGAPSRVTVTLTCAPSANQSVSLTGFAGIHVPSSVRVLAGRSSAGAAVGTDTRTSRVSHAIAATYRGVTHHATLTVLPTPRTCSNAALSGVAVPSLVYVGDHPHLRVTLTCATASAIRVTLALRIVPAQASSFPNPGIGLPASITIGRYYRTKTVVLTPQAFWMGQYAATVTAHYGGVSRSRSMTVDPGLASFASGSDSCSPNDVSLSALLTGYAPAGGVTVRLRSSNAAIAVPSTYQIAANAQGATIPGVVVHAVTVDTPVTITASLGSRAFSTSLKILRPWRAGDKIFIATEPDPLYGAGDYSVSISLDHPAPSGSDPINVTVSSDHPSDVQPDTSSVSVDPGCMSTGFNIAVAYETAPIHARITASSAGSSSSLPITTEPSLASVTMPPAIVGGQSATGTVNLAGAPDEPETVYLQSGWGILTVPNSVVVPAGHTSASFPITTYAVTTASQVSVNAFHLVGDLQADTAYGSTMVYPPPRAP